MGKPAVEDENGAINAKLNLTAVADQHSFTRLQPDPIHHRTIGAALILYPESITMDDKVSMGAGDGIVTRQAGQVDGQVAQSSHKHTLTTAGESFPGGHTFQVAAALLAER